MKQTRKANHTPESLVIRAGSSSSGSSSAFGKPEVSPLLVKFHGDITPLHALVFNDNTEGIALALPGLPVASILIADGESGWTPMHRALHWGRLRCAALLLQKAIDAGAAPASHLDQAKDFKGRTPLDLLSQHVHEYRSAAVAARAQQAGSVGTSVVAWGSGANFQLGTGATDAYHEPSHLEAFDECTVVQVAASKFSSAAVTDKGELFLWGFGRGGRLGHPHLEEQAAVIHPRRVEGLARVRVVQVALGKHHSLACDADGHLWSWGTNRDGRLGYSQTDSQATPRRVMFGQRGVTVRAIAAGNKHSAAVSASGEVYTWGANDQGQLGYGTHQDGANAVPRIVEFLKGRKFAWISAAKRHSVALSLEGEVWTWGHKNVTPTRVLLAGARDVARLGGGGAEGGGAPEPLAFHRGQADVFRPRGVAIAAGAAHSLVLTADGVVLAWRSTDPALKAAEVGGALTGRRAVAIAAGKNHASVATQDGAVYFWEGVSHVGDAQRRDRPADIGKGPGSYSGSARDAVVLGSSPVSAGPSHKKTKPALEIAAVRPLAVPLLRRCVQLAVGEKHTLALQQWSIPAPPPLPANFARHAAARPSLPSATPPQPQPSFSYVEMEMEMDGGRSSGGFDDSRRVSLGSEGSSSDLAAALDYAENLRLAAADDSDASALSSREPSAQAGAPTAFPSLKTLCEVAIPRHLTHPRHALQVFEYADALESPFLASFCREMILQNLDVLFAEDTADVAALPEHLLESLEATLSWRLDPPAADTSASFARAPAAAAHAQAPAAVFRTEAQLLVEKQICSLQLKLQQIEALETAAAAPGGARLDLQQKAKLLFKPYVTRALATLEGAATAATAGLAQPGHTSAALLQSLELLARGREAAEREAQQGPAPAAAPGSLVLSSLGKPPVAPPISSSLKDAAGTPQKPTAPPSAPMSTVRGFSPAGGSPRGGAAAHPAPSPSPSQAPSLASGGMKKSAPIPTNAKKSSLSLFLRGELDRPTASSSTVPAPRAFAWGPIPAPADDPAAPASFADRMQPGSPVPASPALGSSLRSAARLAAADTASAPSTSAGNPRASQLLTKPSVHAGSSPNAAAPAGPSTSGTKLTLQDFLKGPSAKKVAPAPSWSGWGGAGAGPSTATPAASPTPSSAASSRKPTASTTATTNGSVSLKDILKEEEDLRRTRDQARVKAWGAQGAAAAAAAASASTAGSAVLAAVLGTSPPSGSSRWFVPEHAQEVTSLRDVQLEAQRQREEEAARERERVRVAEEKKRKAAERKEKARERVAEAHARASAAAVAAATAAQGEAAAAATPTEDPAKNPQQQRKKKGPRPSKPLAAGLDDAGAAERDTTAGPSNVSDVQPKPSRMPRPNLKKERIDAAPSAAGDAPGAPSGAGPGAPGEPLGASKKGRRDPRPPRTTTNEAEPGLAPGPGPGSESSSVSARAQAGAVSGPGEASGSVMDVAGPEAVPQQQTAGGKPRRERGRGGGRGGAGETVPTRTPGPKSKGPRPGSGARPSTSETGLDLSLS